MVKEETAPEVNSVLTRFAGRLLKAVVHSRAQPEETLIQLERSMHSVEAARFQENIDNRPAQRKRSLMLHKKLEPKWADCWTKLSFAWLQQANKLCS